MKVFVLVALLSAGVVQGANEVHPHEVYELVSIQRYQEKKITIWLKAYISALNVRSWGNDRRDSDYQIPVMGWLSITSDEEMVEKTFESHERMIRWVKAKYCSEEYRPQGKAAILSYKGFFDLLKEVSFKFKSKHSLVHLGRNFNIRVGYYGGEEVIYEDITCKL